MKPLISWPNALLATNRNGKEMSDAAIMKCESRGMCTLFVVGLNAMCTTKFIILSIIFFSIFSFADALISDGAHFNGAEMRTSQSVSRYGTFTIDVMLQTDASVERDERVNYAENTPSMPFLIGTLGTGVIAAHVTGNGYYIRVEGEDRVVLFAGYIGNPDAMSRLTFAGGPDGLVIYVDGGEVFRTSQAILLDTAMRVGRGYQQRFWAGHMAFLDIYDGVVVTGEFDGERTGRLPPDRRVLTLSDLR